MAISQAMCTSFKKELMTATHNFTAASNVFKLALYTSSASLGAQLLHILQVMKQVEQVIQLKVHF